MSQAKIKRVLENYSDDIHSISERGTIKDYAIILDQALAEINKIVMKCLPKEMPDCCEYGGKMSAKVRGNNEAIAEFRANWEAK